MSDSTEPHQEDEDAEQFLGDELKDPWADSEQTDWADNEEES